MRSFINCILQIVLRWSQQEGIEFGGDCGMHERDEKCIQNFNQKA
jgi:hypothetical protein